MLGQTQPGFYGWKSICFCFKINVDLIQISKNCFFIYCRLLQKRRERNSSEYNYRIEWNENGNPVPLTKSSFMTKNNLIFFKKKNGNRDHQKHSKIFDHLPTASLTQTDYCINVYYQMFKHEWKFDLSKVTILFSIRVFCYNIERSYWLDHFWTKRKWKMASLKITHFRCYILLQQWKELLPCFWS